MHFSSVIASNKLGDSQDDIPATTDYGSSPSTWIALGANSLTSFRGDRKRRDVVGAGSGEVYKGRHGVYIPKSGKGVTTRTQLINGRCLSVGGETLIPYVKVVAEKRNRTSNACGR